MPLTEKGAEIMKSMKEQYGEEKGESVFYASRNAGTISGVDAGPLNPASPSAAPLPDPGDPLPQPAGPNALPRPAASTMGGGYDAASDARLPGQVSASDVFRANRIRDRSW